MRSKVEEAWNLFATDNYGMSELMGPGVSGECRYRCGMHFAEDHFLPEIINPQTGEVRQRGEEGELVVTTLTKEGIPLLRYRTKDITRHSLMSSANADAHTREWTSRSAEATICSRSRV